MQMQKTVKLKHHRTEITHGDNGGLVVEHRFKSENDGDSYPTTMNTEKNVYGANEHAAAMKDIQEKCCGDVQVNRKGAVKTGTSKKGPSEKELMHNTKAKVGAHLATLGVKNAATLPN